MKDKNKLQLGDLVSLEGLEKPQGVFTVELGGKQINQLGEKISDFAGKIEDQHNVQVGEIAGLVDSLNKAMVKELSPEKAETLLKTLQYRFENKENMKKRHPRMEWTKVQAKLETSPEKLWSLQQMEDTGGEPDVLGQDEQTGEYIFMDCSAESPRQNCVYDREGEQDLNKKFPGETCNGNAVSRAALMGVNLLTESEYRELQRRGEFDKKSWGWLKTPLDKRRTGVALYGLRHAAEVRVNEDYPYRHDDLRGFRASLRV